jgi:hypothetical protein
MHRDTTRQDRWRERDADGEQKTERKRESANVVDVARQYKAGIAPLPRRT